MHGYQTVSTRDAPLTDVAARWRAVWEVGERIALVDGVSSLLAAGLRHWEEPVVHVSVMHNHTAPPVDGVRVHKIIRRVADEAVSVGLPRTRPAVAAIRAAHWAVTDRQAVTILAMVVQQRIVSGPQLLVAAAIVRGRNRRALIRGTVQDVAGGAQSLGELDFVGACRRRGLPEPTRQAVRRTPDGRIYLDALFEEYGLAVEIDGAGHYVGLARGADNRRANFVVIEGSHRVLRLDVLELRLDEGACMAQLAAALASDWAQANLARSRGRG